MAESIYFNSQVKHTHKEKQPKNVKIQEIRSILSMITKELLIHRPMNIFQFCARFLEHELDRRTLSELTNYTLTPATTEIKPEAKKSADHLVIQTVSSAQLEISKEIEVCPPVGIECACQTAAETNETCTEATGTPDEIANNGTVEEPVVADGCNDWETRASSPASCMFDKDENIVEVELTEEVATEFVPVVEEVSAADEKVLTAPEIYPVENAQPVEDDVDKPDYEDRTRLALEAHGPGGPDTMSPNENVKVAIDAVFTKDGAEKDVASSNCKLSVEAVFNGSNPNGSEHETTRIALEAVFSRIMKTPKQNKDVVVPSKVIQASQKNSIHNSVADKFEAKQAGQNSAVDLVNQSSQVVMPLEELILPESAGPISETNIIYVIPERIASVGQVAVVEQQHNRQEENTQEQQHNRQEENTQEQSTPVGNAVIVASTHSLLNVKSPVPSQITVPAPIEEPQLPASQSDLAPVTVPSILIDSFEQAAVNESQQTAQYSNITEQSIQVAEAQIVQAIPHAEEIQSTKVVKTQSEHIPVISVKAVRRAKSQNDSVATAKSPVEPASATKQIASQVPVSIVEDPAAEEATAEEPKVEEPKTEESKSEEPTVEEPKVEEPTFEEPKVEEPKAEDTQVEELKAEEPKAEEPKAEEPIADNPEAVEPTAEEPTAEEPKSEEPKAEERISDEPKTEEPKYEETKVEELNAEEPKVEEPKVEEPKAEEPKAEEISSRERNADEPKSENENAEETKVEDTNVEEPTAEVPKAEEPNALEPKAEDADEPKVEEAKAENPKAEEPNAEEPKAEEPTAQEPKVEEPKAEEPKVEEPKAEEPKAEETTDEEPKAEEPTAEEPKAEEPKAEEPKAEEQKAEEPKTEDTQVEEPKAEEPKAEEPTAEEPKTEETKAEEPKAEEQKAEEQKADEPKVEETTAEEPKAEEQKAEEQQADEPKVEETTAEEPKADEKTAEEPKAEEPTTEEAISNEPATTNEPGAGAVEPDSTADGPSSPSADEPTPVVGKPSSTADESTPAANETVPIIDEPVTAAEKPSIPRVIVQSLVDSLVFA